jgi:acetoin utilization protein AcuC
MSQRRLAFLYSPDLAALNYPPECPFNTHRAVRTRERLLSFGLLDSQAEVAPGPATRSELERFHTPAYLDELERATAGDLRLEGLAMGLGTPDTPVFRDLWAYATRAAGASLTAADLILTGKATVAFNPWGGLHHALPAKASGFCYINDVVLACQHLADNAQRVVCLDVDAHHGDGIQGAFADRSDVFTISLHQSGHTLYPWTGFEDEIGHGPGRGYNVNIPLPPETYDDAYWWAFRETVPPLITAYRPDVIVLELGMDTLAGDPLTHLRLTNNVLVDVIHKLQSFDVPLLVTGGGGYHIENTVRGWARAWKTLAGGEEHDLSIGLGGEMLGTSEWAGGLRDHHLPVTDAQRRAVLPAIEATVRRIHELVFPLHGL